MATQRVFVFCPGADPGALKDRLLQSGKLQQYATCTTQHSDALLSFSIPEGTDCQSCCQQALQSCAMEGYVSTPLSPTSHAALVAVEGMTCNSCVKLIESTLSQREGVAGIRVSLKHKEAFVQFDPRLQSAQDLVTAIFDMGFDAELKASFSHTGEPTSSDIPILEYPLTPAAPAEEEVVVIGVEGMVCHSCVQNIEANVGKMKGVKEVKVSLEGKNARVTYVPSLVGPEELSDAIEDLGFEAKLSGLQDLSQVPLGSNSGALYSPSSTLSQDDSLLSGTKRVCSIGIEGMTCHSCVSLVESAVGEVSGVMGVSVSLPNKEGTVEYNNALVTSGEIKKAVEGTGFVVTYIIGMYV